MSKVWFTLVELLVVVTIIAVLSTVGLMSYQGLSSGARDSARTAALTELAEWLSVANAKNGTFPLPDTPSVTIANSWVTIGYQGYAGTNVLAAGFVKWSIKDPLDNLPYTYSVNATQDKMELLALLESQNTNYSMVPKAYAVSLANRYPVTKGSNLGIILSSASGTLNQPLQSLVTGTFDVMNSGATNYTAYQSTTSTIVWSGSNFQMLAANFSNLPSWSDMNSLLNGSSWNSYLGNINATIQKNPWNSAQDSVTTFGNLATLAGGGSYCGWVLAPNGNIYEMPNTATGVLVINPTTNTVATLSGVSAGNNVYCGWVLAPNGNIYGIPANATGVLVINPTTNTVSTIGNTIVLSGASAGTWAYIGWVLAPNGNIYGIPANATSVLVINPTTNTVSTFGNIATLSGYAAGGNDYLGWVLAPNGNIYGIPNGATGVLQITPGGISSNFDPNILLSPFFNKF